WIQTTDEQALLKEEVRSQQIHVLSTKALDRKLGGTGKEIQAACCSVVVPPLPKSPDLAFTNPHVVNDSVLSAEPWEPPDEGLVAAEYPQSKPVRITPSMVVEELRKLQRVVAATPSSDIDSIVVARSWTETSDIELLARAMGWLLKKPPWHQDYPVIVSIRKVLETTRTIWVIAAIFIGVRRHSRVTQHEAPSWILPAVAMGSHVLVNIQELEQEFAWYGLLNLLMEKLKWGVSWSPTLKALNKREGLNLITCNSRTVGLASKAQREGAFCEEIYK
ncbi:hypothetical protein A2U01_0012289, partial [Trifolium medium]|nr:hypothetical protein [Trifolium medium]